jgi:hypothetical protein
MQSSTFSSKTRVLFVDGLIRDRVAYFHQEKKEQGVELLSQLPTLFVDRTSCADDATIRSQVLQDYIRAVLKSQSIYYLCHEYITAFLGFAAPLPDLNERNSLHSGEDSLSDRESVAHRNHDTEKAFAMLREARERKAIAQIGSADQMAMDRQNGLDRESLKVAILGDGLSQKFESQNFEEIIIRDF